ncbi:uncharacterized protein LOC136037970 isoform X2 [Artemia franciscana]|uniref:uncharacterized protein LOC136037970 isoform X2 n=1 Tax=Artemia franciscana TaxID=6661 RepID=UPI0032DAA5A6
MRVLVAIYGPFPESHLGNSHLCLIVDEYSTFSFIFPLDDRNLESVVDHLFTVSSIFGLTKFSVINFEEEEFSTLRERFVERLEEFSKFCNISWNKDSVAVVLNGSTDIDKLVEEFILDFVSDNPTTWDQELDLVLLKLRIGHRPELGCSPYYLMFKKDFPNITSSLSGKRRRKVKPIVQPETNSNSGSDDNDGNDDNEDSSNESVLGNSGTRLEKAKQKNGEQLLTLGKNDPIRPTKYVKLSLEMREEIAKYAIASSFTNSSKVYSKKLNVHLSTSTIRYFVAVFRKLTPSLKDGIGRSMVEHGYAKTCEEYSKSLGFKLTIQLAKCLQDYYIKKKGGLTETLAKNSKLKLKFCEPSRLMIGQFAVEHGSKAAVEEFSKRFKRSIPEGTVRKFKWIYMNQISRRNLGPPKDPPEYPKLPAYPGHPQKQDSELLRMSDVDLREEDSQVKTVQSENERYVTSQMLDYTHNDLCSSLGANPKEIPIFEYLTPSSSQNLVPYHRWSVDTNFSNSLCNTQTQCTQAEETFLKSPINLSIEEKVDNSSTGNVTDQTQNAKNLAKIAIEKGGDPIIKDSYKGKQRTKLGRKPIIPQYEPVIKEKLLEIAKNGGQVSERVVLQISKQVVSAVDPELSKKISVSWVKSFLRRMRKS